MARTIAALLTTAVVLINGQTLSGLSTDDLSAVEQACNPTNSSGLPDFNAPCNAVKAIEYQCIYGPAYFAQSIQAALNSPSRVKRQQDGTQTLASPTPDASDDPADDGDIPTQSNSTQRTCICESQFFDQIQGCSNCYSAHGSSDFDDSVVDAQALSSLSSSYCAASATPSVGLADFLFEWADSYNSSHPATSSATSTASDRLGNQTAVSLYFTPSVTGSAAYVIAEATSGASSGMGSITSQNTVSGQIAATASANNQAAQSNGASGSKGASAASGSSTGTSSGGAAVATAAAGMGILGLAGLVAIL